MLTHTPGLGMRWILQTAKSVREPSVAER